MRSIVAPALALIALPLALAACHGTGDPCERPERSCPAPFDVSAYCHDTRSCTVAEDPAAVFCDTTACLLKPGEHAQIPIGDFASLLSGSNGGIHDLFIDYADTQWSADPLLMQAAIDGVVGAATRAGDRGSSAAFFAVDVRWNPFPQDPMTLTLSYTDGQEDDVSVLLLFEDGACEDANAVEACPL